MLMTQTLPLQKDSEAVLAAHKPGQVRYRPEDNPFRTLIVDITHRCNMKCLNCYIPNRNIPDMNAHWLEDILARLPRRTRVRLVGAEPTVREDLPDLIRMVKRLKHHPLLLTNGLRFSRRDYAASLKQAGLRLVYISFNGGLDDQAYLAVDDMACAEKKRLAVENACAEHLYTSLGMILVRGMNTHQIKPVFQWLQDKRPVRELNLRSVGQFGRYIDTPSFSLDELEALFFDQTGFPRDQVTKYHRSDYACHFYAGHLQIQLTQWPDLGSTRRGRLAPDGMIEPFFEHVLANEGGY